ncbi:hypothetical protein HK098_003147 [Nowakowskiella sp. JEL0407]|nr:hypothetical protein HK098_003147 [Nowakowskiella sp. JEL0407]
MNSNVATLHYNTFENKRPIIFVSVGHLGELSITLRLATQYAMDHPDENVVLLSTSVAEKYVKPTSPNFSYFTFGERGSLTPEISLRFANAFKNGPDFIKLFSIFLEISDEYPYPSYFSSLKDFFEKLNPRILVIDYTTYPAIDVAKLLKIPYIVLMAGFFSFGNRFDYEAASYALGTPCTGKDARSASVVDYVQNWYQRSIFKFCAMYFVIFKGLHRDRIAVLKQHNAGISDSYVEARAVISACTWGIEYPIRTRPNVHAVGPIILESTTVAADSDSEIKRWIDINDSPIIFISLGSACKFEPKRLGELIDVLLSSIRDLNIRVLWKYHKSEHEQILQFLQSKSVSETEFKIVSWVDDILGILSHPKITVNVNHAGGNSFNEALYCGVPQLLLPFWADCFDIAIRGQSVGVGISVLCQKSFAGIKPALQQLVSDPSYRVNSKFWSEKSQIGSGCKKAIQVIEEIAEEVRVEEKYGRSHTKIQAQTSQVITDPSYIGWGILVVKLLSFAVVFGLGISFGSMRSA